MGTLTDITSSAGNKQLRSVDSPMQTPKSAPSQSEGQVKGNFMSPTMASSKKANPSPTPKDETRNSTPTSIKLEKASTAKWVTSAARRVGLRRDGAPRSKKERLKSSGHAVTLPDKLSTSSRSNMPDLPRPRPTPTSSFPDKPLPSPPIAHVLKGNPGEARSLIDASEKPLQRTSPKSPSKQEEWPVLFPAKPTTPDSIREMLHQTTPERARLVSNEQEKHLRLSGSQSATSNIDQEPVARLPSTVQIQRKQLSSSSLHENSLTDPAMTGFNNDIAKPTARTTIKYSDLVSREPKETHRLSAGAAAVEKSSMEAKSIKEPRQTRTSSLRARISAGQVIKDSPNKVLGFTDFTAERGPSAKESKENLSRQPPSTSFGKAFMKKPSKEYLGGTRPPAQFVAGSRRPIARRPSSRNDLRSDSRASSPTYMEPSRPAPPIPNLNNDMATRKSSIPVFRNTIPITVDQAVSQEPPIDLSTSAQFPGAGKDGVSHFEIFEDKPTASTRGYEDIEIAAAGDMHHAVILESIEESPRSTMRSKRISLSSPTLGPMLKISSSADRLIMGTEPLTKENRPLLNKRSTDLFRTAVANEQRNVAKNKSTNNESGKITNRPLSSQGFTDKGQRNDTAVGVPRAEQVNSVDLGNFSHLQKPSTKHVENTGKSRDSSATDDPFFDALEQRMSQPETVKDRNKGAEIGETSDGSEPGLSISPVKGSATPVSDAMPVIPAFLPETLQQHVQNSNCSTRITRADEVKERKGGQPAVQVDVDIQQHTDAIAPSTPDQKAGDDAEAPSNSFPPRGSSRMQHPEYIANESARSSPISSLHQAATRLQNQVSVADFANSKAMDADSFGRSINVGTLTPHHGQSVESTIRTSTRSTLALQRAGSSQMTLADGGSKRNSTARLSHKSQSSVSKGLMSNFRGLFQKRPSDVSEAPSHRFNTKSSKRPTVNSHGSPFPSVSNIHPLYRPTQASHNRNNATNQRTSGNSLLSTTPGTPTVNSPLPTEISTTTSLAMQILESARKENSSPKKERLLSLGKIMVDCITQARDAEKAMEEAKQAARKAEVAYALCKKSVGDVANMVKESRGDFKQL